MDMKTCDEYIMREFSAGADEELLDSKTSEEYVVRKLVKSEDRIHQLEEGVRTLSQDNANCRRCYWELYTFCVQGLQIHPSYVEAALLHKIPWEEVYATFTQANKIKKGFTPTPEYVEAPIPMNPTAPQPGAENGANTEAASPTVNQGEK